MSATMNSHIKHLQERLKQAEKERDEAREALRPFAGAYRELREMGIKHIIYALGSTPLGSDDFARAAELIPEAPSDPA